MSAEPAQTKYIFVTGGVTSSLGKGIVCASLGVLLESQGLNVTIQKFDPYLNVDPGTMNPYEHGEVYVTDDGAETDLDLGHYERFLNKPTSQANNVTTGRIYQEVINKERAGAYLGKTVQVVPHVIDQIKGWMVKLGETGRYDVVITEVGGTVGDIESLPYLEAIRQLRYELGRVNTLEIHLTLVPYLAAAGELKTKPTQHSVKTLLSYGLQPDILVCRAERPVDQEMRRKIALFCNVPPKAVVTSLDAPSIYEVPLLLKEEGLDQLVIDHFQINADNSPLGPADLTDWKEFLTQRAATKHTVRIGLIGKYVAHQDAYKSITESLQLAGARRGIRVEVVSILSDPITSATVSQALAEIDGLVVAPGFGARGVDGKLAVIQHARTTGLPFLGICLGMQCATIEFARNVVGWRDAHSTEFDKHTPHPVIDLMAEQRDIHDMGGTMRLGAYPCKITKGTRAHTIYGSDQISERHRHRYEFNNALRDELERHGLLISGINPDKDLVEIIELPDHPFFVGVQFHPEYRSTVARPHPLFGALLDAAGAAHGAQA